MPDFWGACRTADCTPVGRLEPHPDCCLTAVTLLVITLRFGDFKMSRAKCLCRAAVRISVVWQTPARGSCHFALLRSDLSVADLQEFSRPDCHLTPLLWNILPMKQWHSAIKMPRGQTGVDARGRALCVSRRALCLCPFAGRLLGQFSRPGE